jgi:hypothetical protein
VTRHDIEKQIVTKVIADALAAGYTLDVNDGEETTLTNSMDKAAILAALFTTDEDYLVYRKDGKKVGWVQFVYGNDGYDVITNHTINLDHVLLGATMLAERLESEHS